MTFPFLICVEDNLCHPKSRMLNTFNIYDQKSHCVGRGGVRGEKKESWAHTMRTVTCNGTIASQDRIQKQKKKTGDMVSSTMFVYSEVAFDLQEF